MWEEAVLEGVFENSIGFKVGNILVTTTCPNARWPIGGERDDCCLPGASRTVGNDLENVENKRRVSLPMIVSNKRKNLGRLGRAVFRILMFSNIVERSNGRERRGGNHEVLGGGVARWGVADFDGSADQCFQRGFSEVDVRSPASST